MEKYIFEVEVFRSTILLYEICRHNERIVLLNKVLGGEMGMIHFYREYVDLAVKLMDAKSIIDDVKALKDANEINLMINTAKPTVEFVNAAKQLDRRINADYPEINEMHNIASNMANHINVCQNKMYAEYDAILKDLNSDLYGILASVLLKHGKISCIKDFIESVD